MALRHHLFTTVAIASLALSCKDKPADNAVDAAAMTPPATSSVAPLSSTPPAMSASAMAEGEKHGKPGRGGPSAMLFQAARSLSLKDEQKSKLDAAEKDAHAGPDEGMKDAMKDLHTEVIAQIKAGKIDTAKLEPKYAAVDKITTAAHDREVTALNALYAALDAPQRKAAVADVRAKQAKREMKMAERMAEMSDGGADGGKPQGPWMAKRMFEHLTNGLDLDADQQKKVDALIAKEDAAAKGPAFMAEMKKNVEALLAAFEKDGFDAKKVAVFDAKKARGPMEQEAKLLTQLLPILKPEQREKLATKMEKPPPHGRRPGGYGGHRPLLESEDEED